MSEKVVITHDGNFHLDEIMAYAILKKIYNGTNIVRTRNQELINRYIISDQYLAIVDVNGKFDPEKRFFDHHQQGFNETFDNEKNTVKLSSAGLIYKYYAKQLFDAYKIPYSEELKTDIYERYIKYIDAIDNGVPFNSDIRVRSFADIIKDHSYFEEAFTLVKNDLDRFFQTVKNECEIKEKLYPLILNSDEILLTKDMGNISILVLEIEKKMKKDFKYVIDERDGLFYIYAIPIEKNSFLSKVPLKKEWRGLRENDLIRLSSIDGCVFVHATGFMGINRLLEGAKKMCNESLNN